MIAKISRFSLVLNIVIISQLSMIHASAPTQKGNAKKPLTTTPTTPAAKTEEHKTGLLNRLFGDASEEPVSTTPTITPIKITITQNSTTPPPSTYSREEAFEVLASSAQAIPTLPAPVTFEKVVGTKYHTVKFPEQTETSISYLEQKWPTETYAAFVLRLIKLAKFKAAYEKNQNGSRAVANITEDLGRALEETSTAFKLKRLADRAALLAVLQQQRDSVYETLNPIVMITQGATQDYATGSINQQRIETVLKELEKEQRSAEQETDTYLKELQAREDAIKELRTQILKLHPKASTQRPISPSRTK